MGTSTTESKGRETLEMIQKTGGKASFRAGDVSNMGQMRVVVEEAVNRFGGIDILVNSAGVRTNGSVTDISEEDWDRTLDTNLKGAFVTSHLVVPEMQNGAAA
jgi:NAD(P)-dependent dehydrogenase (short-subunit alcohol dehydrogenase family)